MEKVFIELKHCYGIPSLEKTFDFSNNNMPVAIYAPNGMMKTSLAKSFHEYISGKTPVDEIHPERNSSLTIQNENEEEINPDQIFVVDSINEKYQSQKISTLLASEDLKEKYEQIFNEIGSKKDELIKKLKNSSGLSKGIDEQLANDIGVADGNFLTAVARLEREVKSEKYSDFSHFKYKTLFNDTVLNFISNPDFEKVIAEYTDIYEKMIDNSKYFKKGVFNHSNAETISKTLKSHGWFEGGHSVNLKQGGEQTEITSEKQLADAIEEEKNRLLSDPQLKEMFDRVDKAIKNTALSTFRDYLISNPSLVPELQNPDKLKTKIWIGYLTEIKEQYFDLLKLYDKSESEIKEIIARAEAQQTRWEKVIDIFNERFSVPFSVAIENKGDAVLNIDSPQITFYFKETPESTGKKVDQTLLNKVLSNGEKRALYILNIVFEVEARRKRQIETLFLIDDIADSFDYKNKYAIIEYLHDMKEEEFFHLILMSHNYDFYRTVRGRLSIYGENKLIATKENNVIYLNEDKVDLNPFKSWMTQLDHEKFFLASIPFIRNIAEYTGDEDTFTKLTKLLHIKSDSSSISFSQVSESYKKVIPNISNIIENNNSVIESIYSYCESALEDDNDGIQLENKIILSIGIRLKAEAILIQKINDDQFVTNLSKHQTNKLIKKYSKLPNADELVLKLMRQVALMTPENIHLNSFMFEPILDMSIHHLKSLYRKILNLS